MAVALKLNLNLKLLLGAVIGAAISIALFSVLDLFNYIYHPGELPAIRGVNGLVAIILGAFIAGYYSRPKSLSQIVILVILLILNYIIDGDIEFCHKGYELSIPNRVIRKLTQEFDPKHHFSYNRRLYRLYFKIS